MTKIKKTILAFASVATIVAPVAAVVSCDRSEPKKDGDEWWQKLPPANQGSGSNGITSPNFERYRDLAPVKLFFTSHQSDYPDVTEDNLRKITPEDVHNYGLSQFSKIDAQVLKTMNQVDSGIVKWSFENNTNWSSIKLLNDFVKNSSQSASNPTYGARGSVRSADSQGVKKYYRNDYFKYAASDLSGLDLVTSEFVKGNDRQIQNYNIFPGPVLGNRILDLSLASGNSFAKADSAGATFSVFRKQQEGEYKYTQTDNGVVWNESAKFIAKLTSGINLEIGGKLFKGKDGVSEETQSLLSELDNSNNHEIKISVDPGIKYAQVKNGNVTQSQYDLKGKDFYYGFVRQLYVLEELRSKGTANGNIIGLPAFTASEMQNFDNQFGGHASATAFDNKNFYMYDLFGIDLKGTIEANEQAPDDQFIIKFNDDGAITQNVINFLTDTNTLTPIPSQRIKELANGAPISEPGKHFGITTYGIESIGGASINTESDYYSVAPYLYTKYNWAEHESLEISKNPFYMDKKFVDNKNKVEKYIITQLQQGNDPMAYATSRANAFKDATTTHEYILDSQVLSQQTLLQGVAQYANLFKPSRTTPTSYNMIWNPYAIANSGFNNLGYKMFWGEDNVATINASPDAYSEFVNGSGATTRSVINDAVNWYAVIQEFYTGLGKEFYPGVVQEESLEKSQLAPGDGWADYYSSNYDMDAIYKSNQDNTDEAYKSPHFAWDAKKIDEMASALGATASSPAQIPIFRYEFTDSPNQPAVQAVQNHILATLNSLSPKVKFVWQASLTWKEFVSQGNTNKTYPTLLISFGPDYGGIGSILQQFVGPFGTSAEFEFVKEAFVND